MQRGYVERRFGDARAARMTVMADFFKHGFDGDGDGLGCQKCKGGLVF